MRAVDHNGRKSAVDAGLAQLKRIAVIEVQADRKSRFDDRCLDKLHQVRMICVFSGARGNLKNQRRVFFLRRLGDSLDDFHVVDVKGADCISAFIRLFKHFL